MRVKEEEEKKNHVKKQKQNTKCKLTKNSFEVTKFCELNRNQDEDKRMNKLKSSSHLMAFGLDYLL